MNTTLAEMPQPGDSNAILKALFLFLVKSSVQLSTISLEVFGTNTFESKYYREKLFGSCQKEDGGNSIA